MSFNGHTIKLNIKFFSQFTNLSPKTIKLFICPIGLFKIAGGFQGLFVKLKFMNNMRMLLQSIFVGVKPFKTNIFTKDKVIISLLFYAFIGLIFCLNVH